MDASALFHQAQFHQRWSFLRDPQVRDLAWLLDAPDLLDADAARWEGKITRLPDDAAASAIPWLKQLDADPSALHAYLAITRFTRLGRYAENLLAWYFQHQQTLIAHGLQVRAGKDATVGEFDFLLKQGDDLLHWEFATKFYLLNSHDPAYAEVQQADYFVGPNLADTLGKKIRKILDRQLLLGQHQAAQALLPQPVARAQALIKGWLFYRHGEVPPVASLGITEGHCRGWWCTLEELESHVGETVMQLPRLSWLAPAQRPVSEGMDKSRLRLSLEEHFALDPMPVMVATMERCGDVLQERDRGFVVPDDWQRKAEERA